MGTDQLSQFEVLGLSPQYAIDREELETKYLKLATTWHPDRFVGADDTQRLRATARSSAVNQAYAVIRNPKLNASSILTGIYVRVTTTGLALV